MGSIGDTSLLTVKTGDSLGTIQDVTLGDRLIEVSESVQAVQDTSSSRAQLSVQDTLNTLVDNILNIRVYGSEAVNLLGESTPRIFLSVNDLVSILGESAELLIQGDLHIVMEVLGALQDTASVFPDGPIPVSEVLGPILDTASVQAQLSVGETVQAVLDAASLRAAAFAQDSVGEITEDAHPRIRSAELVLLVGETARIFLLAGDSLGGITETNKIGALGTESVDLIQDTAPLLQVSVGEVVAGISDTAVSTAFLSPSESLDLVGDAAGLANDQNRDVSEILGMIEESRSVVHHAVADTCAIVGDLSATTEKSGFIPPLDRLPSKGVSLKPHGQLFGSLE